jgi:putative endonuclease
MNHKNKHFVYIVACADGSYYTGCTKDLPRRLKEHSENRGAKYLRGRLPVQLVYIKEYCYYKNALHGERKIKKLRKKQKEELIYAYANKSK